MYIVYICIWRHICMHMYLYICLGNCIYTRVLAGLCMLYIFVYGCMWVYIYIHIYIYIYMKLVNRFFCGESKKLGFNFKLKWLIYYITGVCVCVYMLQSVNSHVQEKIIPARYHKHKLAENVKDGILTGLMITATLMLLSFLMTTWKTLQIIVVILNQPRLMDPGASRQIEVLVGNIARYLFVVSLLVILYHA